jgi:hypothetical protein
MDGRSGPREHRSGAPVGRGVAPLGARHLQSVTTLGPPRGARLGGLGPLAARQLPG